MTVSLIVPVSRNEEPFLAQALESADAQTYRDIETIVETDPDGTGAAATRNRGLAKASGEYVAFCDADDYMEPDAIERMVEAMDGTAMVAGSFRKFGLFEMKVQHEPATKGPEELASYVMGNLRNPRSNQMLSGCWAKLYRRRLVTRFPAFTTAEDLMFNFDYLHRHPKARFIPQIVYNNRKHAGSLTTTFDERNKHALFEVVQALGSVEKFLRGHYPEEEIRRAVDNSKIYHAQLYFMRICAHTGKPMNEVFTTLYPC